MHPWILAARPKTLPAAIIPVLLGCALAWKAGAFQWLPASLCFAFALLVQIGTNFANDYYDFINGADTPDRIGPFRATASGAIQPLVMKRAMWITFVIAACLGLGLIPYGSWALLIVGFLSIICGFAYTGGPYPLGYHGWGDLLVFIFFGIIAVVFTNYVQTGQFTLEAFIVSLVAGSLTTNILVVNNYRDLETDARAGKNTLAVRFGRNFTLYEYQVLFFIALLSTLFLWRLERELWLALPVIIWPSSLWLRYRLAKSRTGSEYNNLLAYTAVFLLIYGLLLTLGIVLIV